MGLFKKNPFGHYLILKKWLIRVFGVLTHRRYRGFNELQIEGSEIIKKSSCNQCFICLEPSNLFRRCHGHVPRFQRQFERTSG